jgi:uridine kinase
MSKDDLLIARDNTHNYYYSYDNKIGESSFTNLNNVKPLPIMIPNQVQNYYISGSSGSGKSTFCSEIVSELIDILGISDGESNKTKKIENIFFLSIQNEDDPAFSKLQKLTVKRHIENPYNKKIEEYKEPIFINLDINNNEIYALPLEYFKNSVFILDDFDTLEKDIEKMMNLFLRKLITVGRKLNINVFILKHKTMNAHKTSEIIMEARSIVLFPKFNIRDSNKFLENYLHFNKKELEAIRKELDSRYLFIHKTVPNLMIANNFIKLL